MGMNLCFYSPYFYRLGPRMGLCERTLPLSSPSYGHQEDGIVCRGSSLTVWEITARLSTVSLADEWQRQEKLILSNLCDALQIRSVSAGHAKKLRNEGIVVEQNEGSGDELFCYSDLLRSRSVKYVDESPDPTMVTCTVAVVTADGVAPWVTQFPYPSQ